MRTAGEASSSQSDKTISAKNNTVAFKSNNVSALAA